MDSRLRHIGCENASPDNGAPVRNHKVEQARKRISAGDYERPEVIETIITRLLTSIKDE
jgi:hypothetical protein